MMHSPQTPAHRSDRPRISCVVPALNECENLSLLLPALAALLAGIAGAWEIIVVDDGSSDGTPALLGEYAERPGFRYVQLSRNFGKEAALTAGLEAATGEVVVCLDADLQHPIALIPEMLARWREGIDTVYALRENRDDERWLKRLGSSLFYGIMGHGKRVSIPPHAGDFRLMDRQVVDALLALPERTRFMKGLYAWVGFKGEAILYTPDERMHGRSNYNLARLAGFAIDGITAFSTRPLRFLAIGGALVAIASFIYGSYLIVDYWLNGNFVSGWTTIVTAMFFFAGINTLALGIIGAYIARIFDEVKQRPLYIVRRNLGRAHCDESR